MQSTANLSLPPLPFPSPQNPGGKAWRIHLDKSQVAITEACTASTCFWWMFLMRIFWQIQTIALLQGADSRCSVHGLGKPWTPSYWGTATPQCAFSLHSSACTQTGPWSSNQMDRSRAFQLHSFQEGLMPFTDTPAVVDCRRRAKLRWFPELLSPKLLKMRKGQHGLSFWGVGVGTHDTSLRKKKKREAS